MNTLNKIFDKIFVIHCVENKHRYNNILFQKEQNNLDLDIWWTCKHPWSNQVVNGLILSNRCARIINGAEFNITREFYTIIKTAYIRNFKHILIFEDDFCLMKNEYLENFLNVIPNDFDIIQFSISANKDILPNYDFLQEAYKNNKLFMKCDRGYWCNNGLALSRKGMKYYIDCIDKEFSAADVPIFEDTNRIKWYGRTNKNTGLNHYIPTVPLVYLTVDNPSDAQNIDQSNNYDLYKFIDTNYYNIMTYTNEGN